jgi:hypothetical protein
VQGQALRPIDPATGLPLWSAEMGGEPIWVGYLDDKVIVATESRVVALGLEDGSIDWRNDLDVRDPARRRPNPFARAEPGSQEPAGRPSGRLHDFRIVGGRVFCQSGDRELMAIDGDTGLVDWSFSPPEGGELNPLLWIGPRRVALQVRKPNAIVVLETATGRRLAEYPQTDQDSSWMREPLPIDDDRVALVTDRRTVACSTWPGDLRVGLPREPDRSPPTSHRVDRRRRTPARDPGRQRADPARRGDGRQALVASPGVEILSERPEAMALDADRVYWASGRTLNAAALGDGELAWRRHLTGPEAGWSIALTARCVAAFPGTSGSSPEGRPGFPFVFRRRDTGDLVQRLLVPSSVPEVAVRIAHRSVLFATRGDLWAYGDRRTMDGSAPSR